MNKEKLIADDDMTTIRSLAKKYDMSVANFGRLIAKVSDAGYSTHIRFRESEYAAIREKADYHKISLSKCCSRAVATLLKSGVTNIDFSQIDERRNGEKRVKKIYITFPNEFVYKQCLDIAKENGISTASLIRYGVKNYL